jgi:outer membrane protein assembly factor BamB
VVAGFGSGELAALRAETGGVSWTDSLASPRGRNSISDLSAIRGLPVLADRQVYTIGLGGLLLANDLRSGRRLWEREIAGQDTPWAAGDWLFVVSADQQIGAVHRDDGRIAWVSDLPRWDDEEKQEGPLYWFGPVLVGDRLVVTGTNEEALSVSPYTGAILGRQKLSGASSLAPVVAADTVYVTTDDGKLLALR